MQTNDIRRLARERLANTWGIAIAVAAVAALLDGLLTGSSYLPSIFDDQELFSLGPYHFSLRSGILGLAGFLVGGAVELGYAGFLLKQYDGENLEFQDLFTGFERFGDGFVQFFLRELYTFLWGLLLIIPGIVAGYSYSMTPFLMAEDPSLSPSEAITRSKELMDGHKMELFILDLTFIGWDILCTLTMNIGHLALNPYKNAAHAVFYRNIRSTRARLNPTSPDPDWDV